MTRTGKKRNLAKNGPRNQTLTKRKKKKNNHKQVERIQEFRGPGETTKERGTERIQNGKRMLAMIRIYGPIKWTTWST